MSRKRRREQAERRKAMLAAFGSDPLCRAQLKGCDVRASDGHELKRRSQGGDPTDPAHVIPLCRPCHRWVTEHPREARALGLTRWSWEGIA